MIYHDSSQGVYAEVRLDDRPASQRGRGQVEMLASAELDGRHQLLYEVTCVSLDEADAFVGPGAIGTIPGLLRNLLTQARASGWTHTYRRLTHGTQG